MIGACLLDEPVEIGDGFAVTTASDGSVRNTEGEHVEEDRCEGKAKENPT